NHGLHVHHALVGVGDAAAVWPPDQARKSRRHIEIPGGDLLNGQKVGAVQWLHRDFRVDAGGVVGGGVGAVHDVPEVREGPQDEAGFHGVGGRRGGILRGGGEGQRGKEKPRGSDAAVDV